MGAPRSIAILGALVLGIACSLAAAAEGPAPLPGSEACAMCHTPAAPGGRRAADEPPPYHEAALRASPHAGLECTACHADLEGQEFPHPKPKRVDCGNCHAAEQAQYRESVHGRVAARGETLAPGCKDCHGRHDVLRPSNLASPTHKVNVPALCGSCHHEGSPVQRAYAIPQDSILTNYSESMHGEGLFKKGLLTTAVCTSCHTAHLVLPHTDPRSSIAHRNVARTCMQCHVRIEVVHRKVIRGELWEKEPNAIPACVDCHSPHRVRKVFYDQGMANKDCLSCHEKRDLRAADGRAMFVDAEEVTHSRHAKVACAQCHTGATPSEARACRTITTKVDCSVCHAEVVNTYRGSTHGTLAAKGSPDAPVCADCHGTHGIQGHLQSE